MADWKVSREEIQVFPHPNADALDVCRVGEYPIVCQKGLHKTGDVVVFIPEKAILPENLWEGFKNYLRGPNKDRVGSIRLRSEPSMGIVIPDRPEFADIPLGEDISEKLGIFKYEPPVPAQLAGKIKPIGTFTHPISFHDVESYTINKDQFTVGEPVIISEKIHGSLLHVIRPANGDRFVSSKGLIKRQFVLEDDGTNSYWRAVKNAGLFDLLDKYYPNQNVEAYSEIFPVQKGFAYGAIEPTLRLFDIRIDAKHVALDDIPEDLVKLWVPAVYRGPYKDDLGWLQEMANSKERVSGKSTQISEGIVLRPDPDRYSTGKNPFRLMVKVLNQKYKETGDEFQ